MDDAKWGQTLQGDKADETPVFEGKKITFISSNVNVATVTSRKGDRKEKREVRDLLYYT